MYIVGHCVIADLAMPGAFDVYGEDSIALMLPDIVRCHDWGYERCFHARPGSHTGRLVRAHMLADWFVHFGEDTVRERVGWAYRKMAVYARQYDDFFATATARGVHSGEPNDSRRGFSHTLMEYSIDTWLVHSGYFDDRFTSIRDSLGRTGRGHGVGALPWLRQAIEDEAIDSGSPDLAADATSFGERVAKSADAEEFVYRAGVKKFGLEDCAASLDLMADTIKQGLSKIPDDEVRGVVDQAARFVTRWLA